MKADEVDRKMSQFDNDIRDIHSILNDISGTQRLHGNRLDELGKMVNENRLTLVTHTDRLRELDTKVDSLDAKVDSRIDGIDAKVDSVIELLQERLPGGPTA